MNYNTIYTSKSGFACYLSYYYGFIDINNILFRMNAEKLKLLQASVRTGGKGSVRRKKKVIITGWIDIIIILIARDRVNGKISSPLN